jgi:hypothetical protein
MIDPELAGIKQEQPEAPAPKRRSIRRKSAE